MKVSDFSAVAAIGAMISLSVSSAVYAQDALLYRLWHQNGEDADRLYTTDKQEASRSGYTPEGITGKCFSKNQAGTSPLYRVFNQEQSDHFYTTDPTERDRATSKLGYRNEGVTCYVYTDQRPGTCPVYRLFAGKPRTNHFYTLSRQEADAAVAGKADTGGTFAGGGYPYKDEGIAAFIVPYNTQTCPP